MAKLYLLRELMAKDISRCDPSVAYMMEPMRERYSVQSAGLSLHSSFSSRTLGSSRFETL
jgi:hypothetical protein